MEIGFKGENITLLLTTNYIQGWTWKTFVANLNLMNKSALLFPDKKHQALSTNFTYLTEEKSLM